VKFSTKLSTVLRRLMESEGTARHPHSEPRRNMEVSCQPQDRAVLSLG